MAEPTALVSKVIASFRRLNPDQKRTIIALSGGADSIALLFCLSRLQNVRLLAVHVTHDLRSREETEQDYEIAKEAATKCGVDFVRVWGPVVNGCKYGGTSPKHDDQETNREAMARHVRYQALNKFVDLDLSSRSGENFIPWDYCCNRSSGCIATAHHADDQLETMLMRIGRGTGIEGLRCIHEGDNDFYSHNHRIIRPLLELTRADTEEICRINSLRWATDLTNSDKSLHRNRIRAEVVPVLKAMYPNIAEHATHLARIAASAQKVIEHAAGYDIRIDYDRSLPEGQLTCYADSLRMQEDVVIYQWLIEAITRGFGHSGLDKINYQMLNDVIKAVRSYQNKKFVWPGRVIEVTQSRVTVRRPSREEQA